VPVCGVILPVSTVTLPVRTVNLPVSAANLPVSTVSLGEVNVDKRGGIANNYVNYISMN
jgi:hypothetical protein